MFKTKLVCLAVGLLVMMPWYASASIIATTEQGRFDINAFSPSTSAPIEGVIQTGGLQGGNFANSYGLHTNNLPLIRTVGAIPFTQVATEANGALGIQGPGDDSDPLFFAYALSGFVQSLDVGTGVAIALFTEGRLGVFQGDGSFSRFDPDTWVPIQGDFGSLGSPLISWVLTDPIPVFPGEGEQLTGFSASQVNRSGSNANTGASQQGIFLLEEEIDPNYTVTTPGQDGFLDVTTGHSQFVGPTTEGIMVTTGQTATTKFTSGEKLTPSQQAVLQDLSNWGLGVDFATSFHVAGDAGGYHPILSGAGRIADFNPSTGDGGDFFANQDNLLGHPTLFGSVIPEPGTFAIWGLGLIGVAAYARKQRKSRKKNASP